MEFRRCGDFRKFENWKHVDLEMCRFRDLEMWSFGDVKDDVFDQSVQMRCG